MPSSRPILRVLQGIGEITVGIGGLGWAMAMANARYDGGPLHTVTVALVCSFALCLIVAILLSYLMPRGSGTLKVALYALGAVAAAIAALMHGVGIEGILPMRDGGQSIGWEACTANADLLTVVGIAAGAACWRCLKTGPISRRYT